MKKEKAQEPEQPFVWEEYLEAMRNDKKRAVQLIAFYFKARKLKFTSKAQAQIAIRRHIRAANEVAAFENARIRKALTECLNMEKKDGIKWTMETLVKMMTR